MTRRSLRVRPAAVRLQPELQPEALERLAAAGDFSRRMLYEWCVGKLQP